MYLVLLNFADCANECIIKFRGAWSTSRRLPGTLDVPDWPAKTKRMTTSAQRQLRKNCLFPACDTVPKTTYFHDFASACLNGKMTWKIEMASLNSCLSFQFASTFRPTVYLKLWNVECWHHIYIKLIWVYVVPTFNIPQFKIHRWPKSRSKLKRQTWVERSHLYFSCHFPI
jgi:hypothetical protein